MDKFHDVFNEISSKSTLNPVVFFNVSSISSLYESITGDNTSGEIKNNIYKPNRVEPIVIQTF